jgi:alpha-beta hydrolase superfamily lysophospholipase
MIAAFNETTMVTNSQLRNIASRLLGGACAAAVLGLHAGMVAAAPDYAREQRWAAEIVPGVVVGEAVYVPTPSQSRVLALYASVSNPKGGVIVVHGVGVHPDWGLIGGLRTGLADAGFATLSVQMPVLAATAARDDYVALFPEAGERIAAAIAFLKSRGIARIAMVSHSMGASMVNAYLARPDAAHIDAWVPVGMLIEFAGAPKEPVLDVVADNDFPQVREAVPKRSPQLPRDACTKQIVIAGTDHYMENRQKELVNAIVPFLERALAGRC